MKTLGVRAVSIVLIVLGLLSIAIGVYIAPISIYLIRYYEVRFNNLVGIEIWGGVCYIITGAAGLASSWTRPKSLLITTNVFCSISILAAIIGTFFGAVEGSYDGPNYDFDCRYTSYNYCPISALMFTLMATAILAFVTCIALLFLISGAVCGVDQKRMNTTVPMIEVAASDQLETDN